MEPDPWEEQAEALNDEMSCWLADFVLIRLSRRARERKNVLTPFLRCPIAIGKRREYLKKLVWYNNWCAELEGAEVDGRTAEWVRMRDLEHQVCVRCAERGRC